MILTLVRHGETDWNRQKKLQGSVDVPLNDAGRQQARAWETAEILAASAGAPVAAVIGLEEMSFGAWETRTWSEIEELYPEDYRNWLADRRFTAPTGGETYDAAARRALAALAPHLGPGKPHTLVVTHGAVLLSLVCLLRGLPFDRMDEVQMGNLELVPAEAADLLRLDAELNRPGPGSRR